MQGFTFQPFPVISVATGRGRTQTFPSSVNLNREAVSSILRQAWFHYADTLGNLYAATTRYSDDTAGTVWPTNRSASAIPTTPLLRLSARSSRVDTIGAVPVNLLAPDLETVRDRATRQMDLGHYSAFNAWLTLQDGRTVRAHGKSYVLEVLSATGQPTGEFGIRHPIVMGSDAVYRVFVDSMRRSNERLMRNTYLRAEVEIAPPKVKLVFPAKPETLPALTFGAPWQMHGAGDIVWIPVTVEDPPARETWDLVNVASRSRRCRVRLNTNQRLLLVTRNGAYVAARDEWDVERIELYREPFAGCG